MPDQTLLFPNRLVALEGLQVREIKNVQTPPPLDRKDDEAAKITFDVEIVLKALMETSIPIPPASGVTFEGGQEPPQRHIRSIFGPLGPRQETQLVEWNVEVEAISPAGDKDYTNIQLLSVRSKGQVIRYRDLVPQQA